MSQDYESFNNASSPSRHTRGLRPYRLSGWPLVFLILGLASIYITYLVLSAIGGFLVDATSTNVSGPAVGALFIEGEIQDSVWATDALSALNKDPEVMAIVVRIDSPGGSVAPCQEIYQALERIEKPVVVSMGSVAASGGLYIAAVGDKVFANPGTVTGSIGVIMEAIEFSETMEKVGLKSQVIKSGDFKDLGSPFRAMREDERLLLQSLVLEVYEQFVADVAKGRKMSPEAVRLLADGRIFSGQEAKKNGLVDELGSFDDAVLLAAKMAQMDTSDGPPEVIYESERGLWWQHLLSGKLSFLQSLGAPSLTPGLSLKYMYQPSF